jgi:hypothetical protein
VLAADTEERMQRDDDAFGAWRGMRAGAREIGFQARVSAERDTEVAPKALWLLVASDKMRVRPTDNRL